MKKGWRHYLTTQEKAALKAAEKNVALHKRAALDDQALRRKLQLRATTRRQRKIGKVMKQEWIT